MGVVGKNDLPRGLLIINPLLRAAVQC